MKPKMKKNPEFRKFRPNDGDEDSDISGVDRKKAQRKERRVFNPTNIKKYWLEQEPVLKKQKQEDEALVANPKEEYIEDDAD